ncbi:MAG: hypothetical protein ACKVQW_14655 [Pyrinomonadaceae bacterium]
MEMQKGKIDNSELDAIGKTLIIQAFDRSPEIERIVADPYLFARVKARIKAENEGPNHVVASPLASIFDLRLGVAGSIAGFMIATTVGLSFLSSKEKTVADNNIDIPPQKVEVARPLDPPQVNVGKLSLSRATDFEAPRAEKVAVASKRPRSGQVLPDIEFDSDGEFYPVAYTGDIEEAVVGARIIRVDMNRSSLYALGVDLPLENDAETIKADLLVGPNGVTRAVRLVNK